MLRSVRARRGAGVPAVGPAHFARQIDVAQRIAPAESVRGQTALLLACGRAPATGEAEEAEEALRAFWPLDVARWVRAPFPSWVEALDHEPGTLSWFSRYLGEAIRSNDPDVIVIVDPPDRWDPAWARLVDRIRLLGGDCPIRGYQLTRRAAVQPMPR